MADNDSTDEVFVPEDTEDQNVPEGDTLDADPDLPDENDEDFLADVAAGEAEAEDDA